MNQPTTIEQLLENIKQQVAPLANEGKVADYIPALAKIPASKFGMAVHFADGREYTIGDATESFSIQSLSKVFALALALEHIGEEIWSRVGRESSGMSFNSLILIEQENGIPRNPFINAGAIVIVDALTKRFTSYDQQFKNIMRRLSGNETLIFDENVFRSEWNYGDLNRAIAYLLKAKGNLHCDPQEVISYYFRQCALQASCLDLARAARFLISQEVVPTDSPISCPCQRQLHAIMGISGLYDRSGTFAYEVGLPAKSGVGGGIIAIAPEKYSLCVWSPALDERGNSIAGMEAIELFAKGLSELNS